MKITHSTAKGGRYYQEDRFVIFNDDNGTFVAVADGHGGEATASYVAKQAEKVWKEATTTNPILRFTAFFEILAKITDDWLHGSTVSAAYIENEGDIYIAVLGDSPVVLHDEAGVSGTEDTQTMNWLAPEHNVRTNLYEREAAEARGGIYVDGYIWYAKDKDEVHKFSFAGPGLQMGRALGDKNMGPVVSHIPDLFRFQKPKNGFLLLATDGVFDPSHQDEDTSVLKVVNEFKDADAEAYVNRAVKLKTQDNATAIMVKF